LCVASGPIPGATLLLERRKLRTSQARCFSPCLSDADLERIPEPDRRVVDTPVPVDVATWSQAGTLDWWVKERQQWLGRVRGADGKQRWIKAADLRPAGE
jgi:hypothetical protein